LPRSGTCELRFNGYQLPFTPAELFRTSLAAINKELAHAATPFARMSSDHQDAYLTRLEKGGMDLGGVPSEVFFAHLWECTLEGFFQTHGATLPT
jgi:gluconate 2-dehydrogenase gamma chain